MRTVRVVSTPTVMPAPAVPQPSPAAVGPAEQPVAPLPAQVPQVPAPLPGGYQDHCQRQLAQNCHEYRKSAQGNGNTHGG